MDDTQNGLQEGQGAPPEKVHSASSPTVGGKDQDNALSVYELRQALAVKKYEQALAAGEIPPPKPQGKWRKRLKRSGKGLLFFIVLAFGGLALFALIGQESTLTTQNFIDQMWWKMTVVRTFVYAGLAWLLWPYMQRRAKENALFRLDALRREMFPDNAPADAYALQVINEKEEKTRRFHIAGKWVFVGFVVFDMLFLQLPYLIK